MMLHSGRIFARGTPAAQESTVGHPLTGGPILCRRFAPPCSVFPWRKGILAFRHKIVPKDSKL